ncbi:MAG: rhomboid family intramembrane serine protease [Ruminococcus flavefaciens]|nr:rhomboid family intramembrane serine protease [Ruminococcus flavefaciens]
MIKIVSWGKNNVVCLALSVIFIIMYVITCINDSVYYALSSCSINHLNWEIYRYFTSSLLHGSFFHLFWNVIATICIGSLINQYLGKLQIALVFCFGCIAGDIVFSLCFDYMYGCGASGGIFALIASTLVCWLRYSAKFNFHWYRIDFIFIIIYFFVANDNVSSVITHSFGFVFGTIISVLFVVLNIIKPKRQKI